VSATRYAAAAALAFGALAGSGPAAAPVVPPPATLTTAAVRLGAGESRDVPVSLAVSAVPRRVDVMVLLDVSTSMTTRLPAIERDLAATVRRLVADGVDLRVGLAVAGTSPEPATRQADPLTVPEDAAYRPPALFRRVLPVGPPAAFLAAIGTVRAEHLPLQYGDPSVDVTYQRRQGQVLGIDQLLTGRGFAGSVEDRFQDAVAPGQVAGWRDGADVTRVLLDVADQRLGDPVDSNPAGTPRTPTGAPDLAGVGAALAAQRVRHLGVVVMDYAPGVEDMAVLARATRTYLDEGLRCAGLDGADPVTAGAPAVCTAAATGAALASVATDGSRVVDVSIRAGASEVLAEPVVAAVRVPTWAPRPVTAVLRVRCPLAAVPATHSVPVVATYGGAVAARGEVTVSCGATAPTRSDGRLGGGAGGGGTAPVAPAGPGAPGGVSAAEGVSAAQSATSAQQAAQAGLAVQGDVQEQLRPQAADDPYDARSEEPATASWLAAAAAITAAAAAAATRTAPARAAGRP
jgi:hypothetical protein